MSSVEVRIEAAIGAFGAEWDPVFASGAGLQTSRVWFSASAAAALPSGAAARYVAVRDAEGPVALFPMQTAEGGFMSLTTPYTCLYQPLLRQGAAAGRLAAATDAYARACRAWPVTRLEALDVDWPGLALVRGAFARAGLAVRTFSHFVNWHTAVPEGSWEAYLRSRPGALRETIRRKLRAAERAGDLRFELAEAGPALAEALAAYEDVYARSWKESEPYPAFNATLVRALAETGAVRLFVLWRGGQPIAAQYWTVMGGTATVLKLAHDEAFKAVSPGTVLTAFAIRHLIETSEVSDLDFGRGDDPYKRAWTGERRFRIGMLAINVRTRAGLLMLARHDAGRLVRAVRSNPRVSTPR